MHRIYLSLAVILGSTALIATGSTGAFFGDTETSTGNTFAAGAIDLKIDNDSYYNKNRCTNVGSPEVPNWQWQGSATYPVPGTPCSTSFPLSDLDNGLLFFNFTDLKPDDEGEDTISIHVQNDAYVCMDLSLTTNDDKSSTEPELEVDQPEDVDDTWDGELAQNLQFFWWADDGDNVYETDEDTISDGVRTLYNLATTTPFSATLADSTINVWTGTPGPILATQTPYYIGKAWCFGNLSLTPVPEGAGQSPSVNPGVTCDGTGLNNLTQTDGTTLNVAFRAVQARHNPEFICDNNEPRRAKLTVIKELIKDDGGDNVIADFLLWVDGVVSTPVTSGVTTTFVPGDYIVYEDGLDGYEGSVTGDCNDDGTITLAEGDDKTCTITNDDLPSSIRLIRVVINDNPGHVNSPPGAFILRIDGVPVTSGAQNDVTSNLPGHTISQTTPAGYTATISGDAECPLILGGIAILDEGEEITCTITSNEDGP